MKKNVEFDIEAVLGGTVSINLDGLQLLWSIKQTHKQTKTTNYSFSPPGWQTEMRAELSSLWDFGRRFAQHDQVGLGIINIVMIIIIRVEVDEIENIQKEVENDAIDLDSVAERWVLMTVLLGGRCYWVAQLLWIRNNAKNLDTTKTVPMWAALHVLLLDFLRFNLKSQLSRSMPSMPWMEEETRLSWNHT